MSATLLTALARACMASAVLAMQVAGQPSRDADSLALAKLNEAFSILPVPISLDMTFGQFRRNAPHLPKTGLGVQHATWGTRQVRQGVYYSFIFAADAGTLFDRDITAQSPLISFELIDRSDSMDTVLVRTPLYTAVVAQLGPPDFCERDTLVRDNFSSILMRSSAGWRRGERQVFLDVAYDLRDEPSKMRQFRPRFDLIYRAQRTTDKLMSGTMPNRHDAPCFFTDDELRSYTVPMDSATYTAVREKLLLRPERPFEPPN